MIINNLISSVFEGTNISTDDSGIRKRWVYHELQITRSELLKQEFNKKRLFDGIQAQPIEDFKLVKTDLSGSGSSVNLYPIMKSVLKLPKFIESEYGIALDGIYTKMGDPLDFTDKGAWVDKKRRRFTRLSDTTAFIDKGYLFIDGFTDLNEFYVDINAYFDDPVLTGKLAERCANSYSEIKKSTPAYNYEFYAPAHIERRTIEIVRSVIFRRLGVPTDNENNDKQDTQVNASNQVQREPT